MELPGLAGDPLADDSRVLVDEDAHEYFSTLYFVPPNSFIIFDT